MPRLTGQHDSIRMIAREHRLPKTIVLLTDFGTQDAYVGIMKGVIAGIDAQARLIDLTHSIPPGDIHRAAFELWRAVNYFPKDSIYLTVVDPGVGTLRRSIAVRWSTFAAVGPDNGVFSFLYVHENPLAAVELTNTAYHLEPTSQTFHGRDIFAPVAAHLSYGVRFKDVGKPIEYPVRFPMPLLQVERGPTIRGAIMHADRFGNLITSIGYLKREGKILTFDPWLPELPCITFTGEPHVYLKKHYPLPIHSTFMEVPEGRPVAYIGSSGLLEIAINAGNAADTLKLSPEQRVLLH
jgi:S-adenosylmethionine hydrolase